MLWLSTRDGLPHAAAEFLATNYKIGFWDYQVEVAEEFQRIRRFQNCDRDGIDVG